MVHWLSAWPEIQGLWVRTSMASLHCVLEQVLVQSRKTHPEINENVDWDFKNQIKQTNQGHRSSCSGENYFNGFLPYMGVVTKLVM